jgi:Na+-translocating ferredoxin:NAD+ oxidoreductase RnfC subunit
MARGGSAKVPKGFALTPRAAALSRAGVLARRARRDARERQRTALLEAVAQAGALLNGITFPTDPKLERTRVQVLEALRAAWDSAQEETPV